MKTAFQVEAALKKKLKETSPVKNVQAKSLRHPSKTFKKPQQQLFSQPAANKTVPLKRPHPGDNLDESMNTSRKKRVQTSLNVYFTK